jgi:hypothetical protein
VGRHDAATSAAAPHGGLDVSMARGFCAHAAVSLVLGGAEVQTLFGDTRYGRSHAAVVCASRVPRVREHFGAAAAAPGASELRD